MIPEHYEREAIKRAEIFAQDEHYKAKGGLGKFSPPPCLSIIGSLLIDGAYPHIKLTGSLSGLTPLAFTA